MAISVNITLTSVGSDHQFFHIYTDVDNYLTPVALFVSKELLTSGTYSLVLDNSATIIKIQATGTCTNSILIPISGLP